MWLGGTADTEQQGELELISVVANPGGGSMALYIRTRCRQLETQTRPNTEPQGELERNLFYGEPMGGSMALYQNTVSTT